MKVIDLLNKIAKGEEMPKKIKAQNYIWKYEESFLEYKNDKFQELLKFLLGYYNNGGCSLTLFGALDYEVEILEDKTEEIEEIQNFTCLTKGNNGEIIKLLNELSICYGEKINELAREINQIKKDLKPLAIGVDYRNDCDKETNCMTD